MLISNICIHGFMSNLIIKSWTDSNCGGAYLLLFSRCKNVLAFHLLNTYRLLIFPLLFFVAVPLQNRCKTIFRLRAVVGSLISVHFCLSFIPMSTNFFCRQKVEKLPSKVAQKNSNPLHIYLDVWHQIWLKYTQSKVAQSQE